MGLEAHDCRASASRLFTDRRWVRFPLPPGVETAACAPRGLRLSQVHLQPPLHALVHGIALLSTDQYYKRETAVRPWQSARQLSQCRTEALPHPERWPPVGVGTVTSRLEKPSEIATQACQLILHVVLRAVLETNHVHPLAFGAVVEVGRVESAARSLTQLDETAEMKR